jgi:hypothetical protein
MANHEDTQGHRRGRGHAGRDAHDGQPCRSSLASGGPGTGCRTRSLRGVDAVVGYCDTYAVEAGDGVVWINTGLLACEYQVRDTVNDQSVRSGAVTGALRDPHHSLHSW